MTAMQLFEIPPRTYNQRLQEGVRTKERGLTRNNIYISFRIGDKGKYRPNSNFTSYTFRLALLVLSMVLIQPITANPSMTASAKVSEKAFVDNLTNPCSLMNSTLLRDSARSKDEWIALQPQVFSRMKLVTFFTMERVDTVLNTDVLTGCRGLDLPAIAEIPSTTDLINKRPAQVFQRFHTSWLNHTTHVLFMIEQLETHASNLDCIFSGAINSVRYLSLKMRELLCLLKMSTLAFPDNEDDSASRLNQTLNQELEDQPMCSRRLLRDCQVIRSTMILLRALCTYMDTTDVLGNSLYTTEILTTIF